MELAMLIGPPASGKTTYYHTYFPDSHELISLDVLKTRSHEKIHLDQLLVARRPVVIDNTNVTVVDRARYINLAKTMGYFVKGYVFKTDKAGCLRRNSQRTDKQPLPPVAIFTALKRLEPPSLDEGFDELYEVTLRSTGEFHVTPWTGSHE